MRELLACHRYRAITLIWSPVIYLAYAITFRDLGAHGMDVMLKPSDTLRENLARISRGRSSNALSTPSAQVTTFIASDYYFDCTKTVMEVAIIFLAQCSLLGFYLLGLYTDGTRTLYRGGFFCYGRFGTLPPTVQ